MEEEEEVVEEEEEEEEVRGGSVSSDSVTLFGDFSSGRPFTSRTFEANFLEGLPTKGSSALPSSAVAPTASVLNPAVVTGRIFTLGVRDRLRPLPPAWRATFSLTSDSAEGSRCASSAKRPMVERHSRFFSVGDTTSSAITMRMRASMSWSVTSGVSLGSSSATTVRMSFSTSLPVT